MPTSSRTSRTTHCLERLAGLDEAGEARVHRQRPLHTAGQQRLLVGAVVTAGDEGDHRRGDAGEGGQAARRAVHRRERAPSAPSACRSARRSGACGPTRRAARRGRRRPTTPRRSSPCSRRKVDGRAVARVDAVGHVDGVDRDAGRALRRSAAATRDRPARRSRTPTCRRRRHTAPVTSDRARCSRVRTSASRPCVARPHEPVNRILD